MKLTGISAVVIAIMSAGTANAATFTSESLFDAAVSAVTTETFSGSSTSGFTITRNGTRSDADASSISGGQFNDQVWGTTPLISTTFSFAAPVTAFGGTWTLNVNGYGQGLAFFVNGASVGSIGNSDGFFGFTSTTAFSSIEIKAAGLGSDPAETYSLDNFKFGAAVSAVPEPETYALLLAGLGVVGVMGKRRKAG